MNQHAAEMLRCIRDLDVIAARRLWAHVSPHLPQPTTDEEVLRTLHLARTGRTRIAFGLRAYSHAWLVERGLPTALPDRLRPRAERMYPVVVSAVGIAVHSKFKVVEIAVGDAMRGAVLEAEADGRLLDVAHVRGRMHEARCLEMRRLGLWTANEGRR